MAAVCSTRSIIVGMPSGRQYVVRLRDPNTINRFLSVVFFPQPFRQFLDSVSSQYALMSSNRTEYSRRSLVGFAASVGVFKDVPPMYLVVLKID